MTSHEPGRRVPPPFLYFDNLPAWRAEHPHAGPVAGSPAPTILHRPARKSGRGLWPYPTRALLGVLLLLGLCVAVASWNAKPWPPLPKELQGIDLHAKAQTPKVNKTSVETPRLAVARPQDKEKQREMPQPWHPEAPQFPQPVILPQPPIAAQAALVNQSVIVPQGLPEPPQAPQLFEVPIRPPVVEAPALAPLALCDAGSLQCSCFHDLHPGETPMLRNWNVVRFSSLLALAVAVNAIPAASQAEGKEDLKDIKISLDAINKTLDKISANLSTALDVKGDLKSLRDSSLNGDLNLAAMKSSMTALEESVRSLKSELEKLQGRDTLKYPAEKAGMDDLKTRLGQIEQMLAKLADARISKAPPANTGRIQLVNMYPEEMLFVINNRHHRVAAFTTVTLENQPAGAFDYEVISGIYGLRGSNRPLLGVGQTYTITVR